MHCTQGGITKKFKLFDFKKCAQIYLPNNVNNVNGDPKVTPCPARLHARMQKAGTSVMPQC